jgi:hypothetical protein
MHPGSSDYSTPNMRMVNRFLDESSVNLAESFFRPFSTVTGRIMRFLQLCE